MLLIRQIILDTISVLVRWSRQIVDDRGRHLQDGGGRHLQDGGGRGLKGNSRIIKTILIILIGNFLLTSICVMHPAKRRISLKSTSLMKDFKSLYKQMKERERFIFLVMGHI